MEQMRRMKHEPLSAEDRDTNVHVSISANELHCCCCGDEDARGDGPLHDDDGGDGAGWRGRGIGRDFNSTNRNIWQSRLLPFLLHLFMVAQVVVVFGCQTIGTFQEGLCQDPGIGSRCWCFGTLAPTKCMGQSDQILGETHVISFQVLQVQLSLLEPFDQLALLLLLRT